MTQWVLIVIHNPFVIASDRDTVPKDMKTIKWIILIFDLVAIFLMNAVLGIV